MKFDILKMKFDILKMRTEYAVDNEKVEYNWVEYLPACLPNHLQHWFSQVNRSLSIHKTTLFTMQIYLCRGIQ